MLAPLGLAPCGWQGLHGSPPWLSGLPKTGKGHDSRWRLAEYRGEGHVLDFSIGLDRNPDVRCVRLMVTGSGHKVGFMLLENQEDGSALRGIKVEEPFRGRGHSRRFLAAWARLCLEADIVPRTRVINKPLVALGLQRLGFRPSKGSGRTALITHARRLRDCELTYGWQGPRPGEAAEFCRVVHVGTEFVPPVTMSELEATVDDVLRRGSFLITGTPAQLVRALTLRGGSTWRGAQVAAVATGGGVVYGIGVGGAPRCRSVR
jgi:GNAT superfamily N-acetyltransferase